jgi:HD-like signal output (HDOD) protein
MIEEIAKKVDALPPLPKTLIELQEFKKKDVQEPIELLAILEKDPLILATLLKVANSAMFGFRHKVETTKKAIELIGINFTLSIAFGSAIKSTLNTNLDAYGVNSEEFLELANMASNLLNKWVGPWDMKLKEEMVLPVFLQETGKFVLSDIAKENELQEKFYYTIQKNPLDISQYEKEYFGATSSQISAAIFKQWGLDEDLVKVIGSVDDVQNCDSNYAKEAQVLHVVKMLCNPIDPLGDSIIEAAINQAKEYGLHTRSLEKAIETMQDRILDAM